MNIRANSRVLAIALPLIFGAGIAIAAGLGMWVTESSRIPVRITDGEFAGAYDPGDIRGSYSFGDIEEIFEVPASVLAEAFAVTELGDPASIQAKILEETYSSGEDLEIGTDSVRWFVALYTGLPYEPDGGTGMLAPAVRILKGIGVLDETGEALIAGRAVQPETVLAAAFAEHTETAEDEERTIKGKTTFGELKSWGLTAEDIEGLTGLPPGANGESMRDYFSAAGLEFSVYKTGLQELVDGKR